jgi:hypothetical protein
VFVLVILCRIQSVVGCEVPWGSWPTNNNHPFIDCTLSCGQNEYVSFVRYEDAGNVYHRGVCKDCPGAHIKIGSNQLRTCFAPVVGAVLNGTCYAPVADAGLVAGSCSAPAVVLNGSCYAPVADAVLVAGSCYAPAVLAEETKSTAPESISTKTPVVSDVTHASVKSASSTVAVGAIWILAAASIAWASSAIGPSASQ